jgi:hypothetical protein
MVVPSAYTKATAALDSQQEAYYRNFKQSIKSKYAFIAYDNSLKSFMKYKQIEPGQYSKLTFHHILICL